MVPRYSKKTNYGPKELAFGVNPVRMAFNHGLVEALIVLVDAGDSYPEDLPNRVEPLVERARDEGISIEQVEGDRMDQLTRHGVHQGVAARLTELPSLEWEDLEEKTEDAEQSLVILLDSITDVQNMGAILRSAVAVGADAVILPKRRTAPITPAVHKASAGYSLIAPVMKGFNLHQAMERLKDMRYWHAAAQAGEDSKNALSFDWPDKCGLVLGSEAEGVSRLLLDTADHHVELPMSSGVESLNVSVAAAVLSYQWRGSAAP